ncbi:tripartite motif-containing protein 2 isoform X1 [Dendroctonus ponderosae]|uniref:RING-type domain-containing protein n=3 Tax=Dendroctonus ponderosae TaxID=77166 RepID=A0AAR5Q2G7_DENPD|nr:tripartite motif-containing protein 2 isoform X1 [Dendroctonus ponderosae]
MNSTLVETVSINYEDFSESFLTCGTCLCMYNGNEHTPKLLQCSHTVCLHCLTRIAASQTRDTGTFRCPICRELITIPRGGVSALPPSFLVNQLLDLMSRQRREVIPKCSVHINQELLFCETCDTVFCTLCTGGTHNDSTNSCEHTIIPFSIAIKRMSEILLYKANECISKLTQAQEGVTAELDKLTAARDACLEHISDTFRMIQETVERRRQEMGEQVAQMCAEKRRVLEEQHALIESEKNKVEQECQGLQYQVEVRSITQKIEILSEKLDAAFSLGEPRENAFLTSDFAMNDSLDQIQQHLGVLGKVRTSTTFPSLCCAQIEDSVIAGIETCVTLTTVDYHGNARKTGGDPIRAEALAPTAQEEPLAVRVHDCDDGTYRILFRPPTAGRYWLKIFVIDRPIKDTPIQLQASEHNNPVATYGSKGSGKDEFNQPVAVAVDEKDQLVYVLDTGNSRVKVLSAQLEFLKHVTNEALLGRSCTGLAISSRGLLVVNWRSKAVTEITTDGETLRSFTHQTFQEPIDVAVERSYGHILVADNGISGVLVFDEEGKLLFQVGKRGTFSMISSVAVGPTGEIFIADSRVQMFSPKGDFVGVVFDEGRVSLGGIVVDGEGRIVASRTEPKGRTFLQVLSAHDPAVNQHIDSHDSKLKRPAGCAVTGDLHVIVVDLGNNCIKKYRYW